MSDTPKPVKLEANGEVYSVLSYDGYDFPFTSEEPGRKESDTTESLSTHRETNSELLIRIE